MENQININFKQITNIILHFFYRWTIYKQKEQSNSIISVNKCDDPSLSQINY